MQVGAVLSKSIIFLAPSGSKSRAERMSLRKVYFVKVIGEWVSIIIQEQHHVL